MSTISTVIADLPWLSQLVIYFLFVIVIAQLIILKFSLKFWHQLAPLLRKAATSHLLVDSRHNPDRQHINPTTTHPNPKKQPTPPQPHQNPPPLQQISLGLLKNYTFAQPCHTNLSINKNHFLLLVQIWLYMLLCTQIFTPNYYEHAMESRSLYFGFLEIEHVRVLGYLGWVGILGVLVDVGFRYYVTRNIVVTAQNQQKESCIIPINPMNETINQTNQQNPTQTNNPNSPKIISLYYFLYTISSILLFILTLTKLTNSKRNFNTPSVDIGKQNKNILSVTNFYSSQQANVKIAKSFTELIVLMVFHNFLILVVSGLVYLVSYLVEYKGNVGNVWMFVFGEQINIQNSSKSTKKKKSRNNNRKVAHSIQQSLGNLGHQTQRNKIQQQYIFEQNINKTIQQKSVTRNRDTQKHQQSRKIIKTDSINISNKKSLQPLSVDTVLYNRYIINKEKFKQIQELDRNCSFGESVECGQFSLRDIVKNQRVQNEPNDENLKIQGDKCGRLSEKFQTQRIYNKKNRQQGIAYKLRPKQNKKQKKKPKIKAFFQQTPPQFEQHPTQKINPTQQPNTSTIRISAHKNNNNLKLISKENEHQFEQQPNYRVSQPILRNIENKLHQKSLRRKNFKKQLRIVNFQQNCQGIDVIDLNQYRVKDLGCVGAGTPCYVKPVLNFRNRFEENQFISSSIKNNNTIQSKNSITTPSHKYSLHIHNSQKKTYQKRRPSVPEIKTQVTTFCLSDLSFDT